MKFGKTFITHQIPEWSTLYMNYKQLKKRIKTIDLVVNQDDLQPSEIPELIGSILAEFFFELDRDIEKVDEFYNKQYKEYEKRLSKILLVLGWSESNKEINHQIKSSDELDEIVAILLELRTIYRNLKWYGELNHKGFIKILKKLDKKLNWVTDLSNEHVQGVLEEEEEENEQTTTLKPELREIIRKINLPMNHKDDYLATRVNALPFANGLELQNGLVTIGEVLNQLGANNGAAAGANANISPSLIPRSLSVSPSVSGAGDYLKIGDANYSIDHQAMETYYSYIAKDDSVKLVSEIEIKANIKSLIALLNKATLLASYKCIDAIFQILISKAGDNLTGALFDSYDISGRNFFHHHIITLGKKQKIQEARKSQSDFEKLKEIQQKEMKEQQQSGDYGLHHQKEQENERNSRSSSPMETTPGESGDLNRLYGNEGGPDGVKLDSVKTDGIQYLLNEIIYPNENYKLILGPLLNAKDTYQRTPLHYCAQYGLKDLSGEILDFLNIKLNLLANCQSIDDLKFWGDQENLTPLHLAIIGKHPKTSEKLIKHSNTPKLSCPNLLLLAVRLDEPEILDIIIGQGKIDIDYTDIEHNMETALYIASRLNLVGIVKHLIKLGANMELGELVFGWTPIFISALEGYKDVVKVLLENKCQFDYVDESGWLPMEHACLRGHLDVADMLKPDNPKILNYDINNPSNNLVRRKLSEAPNKIVNRNAIYNNNNGSFSTSSIDKLPEPNKNVVNEVYKQLKQLDMSEERGIDRKLASGSSSNSSSAASSVTNSNTRLISRSKSPLNKRKIKPVKSFGHKYLNPDETLILITLGTTDLRDANEPIELNKISMAKTFFTELDTALSLVITCRDKSSVHNNKPIEPPIIIDLPLEDHHGSASDPISFKLTNGLKPEDTIITFDVVPTYQYTNLSKDAEEEFSLSSKKKILGRAVAIMQSAYTRVGPNLRSLNNNITVPIIESSTLDVLGSIRFEYMYVSSFNHPQMHIGRTDTYWKQLVSTRVIGHRGLGKNVSNRNSLQLGENTVESFIAAASLGASYVEFDVQLTKDFVPVIYHDFTVAESGVDIPMHALTAEQFLGLNDDSSEHLKKLKWKIDQANHNSAANKAVSAADSNGFPEDKKDFVFKKNYSLDDEMLSKMHRPRSMSQYPDYTKKKTGSVFDELGKAVKIGKNAGTADDDDDEDEGDEDEVDREFKNQNSNRMKLTKTWKDKGFKGNARGLSIASNFVTLSELFKKLPKNVGFNIELKYPMLDEAEQESMGEIAIDINFYVDTILKVIYDENKNGRDIIFSSFHPDVCLLLSLKQPTMPILFLTEAGTASMADIRASSLQNAIRFAKKWNLLGIVSAAQAIVKTPRLAQVVKSSGLVCVTYGVENNSPELAKIQMKAGVDAVIADSVLAVREGLRKAQESEEQAVNV